MVRELLPTFLGQPLLTATLDASNPAGKEVCECPRITSWLCALSCWGLGKVCGNPIERGDTACICRFLQGVIQRIGYFKYVAHGILRRYARKADRPSPRHGNVSYATFYQKISQTILVCLFDVSLRYDTISGSEVLSAISPHLTRTILRTWATGPACKRYKYTPLATRSPRWSRPSQWAALVLVRY